MLALLKTTILCIILRKKCFGKFEFKIFPKPEFTKIVTSSGISFIESGLSSVVSFASMVDVDVTVDLSDVLLATFSMLLWLWFG
jgi:hypothetical protein